MEYEISKSFVILEAVSDRIRLNQQSSTLCLTTLMQRELYFYTFNE